MLHLCLDLDRIETFVSIAYKCKLMFCIVLCFAMLCGVGRVSFGGNETLLNYFWYIYWLYTQYTHAHKHNIYIPLIHVCVISLILLLSLSNNIENTQYARIEFVYTANDNSIYYKLKQYQKHSCKLRKYAQNVLSRYMNWWHGILHNLATISFVYAKFVRVSPDFLSSFFKCVFAIFANFYMEIRWMNGIDLWLCGKQINQTHSIYLTKCTCFQRLSIFVVVNK